MYMDFIVRWSYLYNGNSITGKTASSYCIHTAPSWSFIYLVLINFPCDCNNRIIKLEEMQKIFIIDKIFNTCQVTLDISVSPIDF